MFVLHLFETCLVSAVVKRVLYLYDTFDLSIRYRLFEAILNINVVGVLTIKLNLLLFLDMLLH